jgi:flagellar basal-body rod protein FlgG
MLRAFSTAATAMAAQQMMVDVTANNLANINTTGFKRSQIDFQDLLYVAIREPGAEVASGITSPTGIEVGSDTRYTRDGALHVNAEGALVTTTGYAIEPAVSIPTDAVSVDIGKDGGVNVTDSSGTISVVGTIQLVRFPNPSGLSSEGDNLLAETEASGTATTGTAGESGFGTIQSGFLEKSNVQMITELVNLISAQRAYETNSRAIRAGDEMLRQAIQIARF